MALLRFCSACTSPVAGPKSYCTVCRQVVLALPNEEIVDSADPAGAVTYKVTGLLSQGGQGAIYTVKVPPGRFPVRAVVLKELVVDLVKAGFEPSYEPYCVFTFEREARMLQFMQTSSYVPRFLRYFVSDGRRYIVMEHVEGRVWIDLITPGRGLSQRNVVHMGVELMRALNDFHQKHIVHRDLKPSNLIQLISGGLCVLDFGLTKERNAPVSPLTRPMGTESFSSLQQAAGMVPTPLDDIYSAAAVLYTMITGRVLNPDVMARPAEARTNLPGSWRPLLGRALSNDPNDRPQDVAEFALELMRVIDPDVTVSPVLSAMNVLDTSGFMPVPSGSFAPVPLPVGSTPHSTGAVPFTPLPPPAYVPHIPPPPAPSSGTVFRRRWSGFIPPTASGPVHPATHTGSTMPPPAPIVAPVAAPAAAASAGLWARFMAWLRNFRVGLSSWYPSNWWPRRGRTAGTPGVATTTPRPRSRWSPRSWWPANWWPRQGRTPAAPAGTIAGTAAPRVSRRRRARNFMRRAGIVFNALRTILVAVLLVANVICIGPYPWFASICPVIMVWVGVRRPHTKTWVVAITIVFGGIWAMLYYLHTQGKV